MAARPATLPAAIVPVLVGRRGSEGEFSAPGVCGGAAWLVLIQIGTNFANDLFDFRKGADTDERLGPCGSRPAG